VLHERHYSMLTQTMEVVEDFDLKQLVFSDGSPFVPGNDIESNCALDRELGAVEKSAIAAAAKKLMQLQMKDSKAGLDFFVDETAAQLGNAKKTDGVPLYLSLTVAIERLHKIQGIGFGDPGRYTLFANTQGFYSEYSILNYSLVAYSKHLGIHVPQYDSYLEYFRKKDRGYKPPQSFNVVGCDEPLTYRWPLVSSIDDNDFHISPDETVHYGVCTSTAAPWVYHYSFGWKKLAMERLPQFCKIFGHEEEFSATCRAAAR